MGGEHEVDVGVVVDAHLGVVVVDRLEVRTVGRGAEGVVAQEQPAQAGQAQQTEAFDDR